MRIRVKYILTPREVLCHIGNHLVTREHRKELKDFIERARYEK